MKPFLVADLTASGELHSEAEYTYSLLERLPGAIELITDCATALWRSPEQFDLALPAPHRHIAARWAASAKSAGIATIRAQGELVSLSLLACGVDPDADRITLEAFQHHLLRELRDTQFEPAFALMQIDRRPLLATINFSPALEQNDRPVAALLDRCFAAAYFRMQGLA